jgi:SAM-dependent methyltransferase
MLPRFDADTAALVERASLNADRSAHDLEQWIIGQLRVSDGMRILDLGCGTGKQVFSLADAAGPGASIRGVDISPEAVAAVNGRAEREGRTNVRAVQASLDDCPGVLDFGPFDVIVSAYAIYYATDMPGLLLRLSGALAPGGQLFVCGPGQGTNEEIVEIINDVAGDPGLSVPPVADFVSPPVLDALGGAYAEVLTARLANSVRFLSPEEVLRWWRNHNAFRPQLEAEVTRRIADVFARDGHFHLTKNVLGVRCRVD